MKKKPERYSFKKLTTTKKTDLKYLEELRNSYEKNRTQSKNKSTEKVISAYQTNAIKFKINKNPQERTRFKTEFQQSASIKPPFQKFINFTKNERDQKGSSKSKHQFPQDSKNKYFLETKHVIKKLHLGSDLYDIKNNSLDKSEAPYAIKNHYSFRKAHQSHRSNNKKTALQKYVSQSLENLELPNKQKIYPTNKQHQIKNTLKKQGEDQHPQIHAHNNLLLINKEMKSTSKQRKIDLNQIERKQSEEKTSKFIYGEKEKESGRKMKTEKDDSLQKIDIKWEKKKKNAYDLSREEMETFGDRFPDGFEKIKLLGRGGFSLVWLGEHKKSKKKYAIKQIITESSHQTHIKEIWFGTYFFEFGGAPKEEFVDCPGINNLVKLYYYFINKKDTWILYEKCGDSLGNALYELKSQQFNSEKVYRIHYKEFYQRIKNNQSELRKIILDIAKALQLLSENNIVHSDLKTENILVRLKTEDQILKNQKESHVLETKLIDYGSSFVFSSLRQFSMATPEYMAPEILNFILYENEFQYIPKLLEYVQKYNNAWVIDVWSLGSVILEIVSGIPLWMSLKTIVKAKNSSEIIKYGLFAIKGRAFEKIIKQQLEVVQNLDHYLYQENYSGIVLEEDIKILLKKMLALNPAKRISPAEIVQFLEPSSNSNSFSEN